MAPLASSSISAASSALSRFSRSSSVMMSRLSRNPAIPPSRSS